MRRCTTATLRWSDKGTPISEQFDDIYFSPTEGIAEARYVFIQHNHLYERWKKLNPDSPGDFIIAETGFGTGLNFLIAWQLWQQLAPENWRLHYISVELYPLSRTDLVQSLAPWSELKTQATELVKNYPALTPGAHTIDLDDGKVCLLLMIDDVNNCLPALSKTHCSGHPGKPEIQVDAWFLDGFAPAKNPQMWHPRLYESMRALSKPGKSGATFATFTAAGHVRRGLQQAGFSIEKVKGFANKRDMTRGCILNRQKESC